MSLKNMTQIRDQLKKWKSTPPLVSQKLLNSILENLISKDDLDKSKLFKIVQDIAFTQVQNFQEQEFSQSDQIDQYKKVVEIAKEVSDLFQHAIKYNKLQKKRQKKTSNINIREEVQKDFKIIINVDDMRQDLFEDFKDQKGNYVDIKPYLSVISNAIIQNLEQQGIEQEQPQTNELIKSVTLTMVREIYYKHQDSQIAVQNFKSDMKTLLTYIKRDKNSFVIKGLLSGEFTAKTAALLRSSEWASQEMKDEEKRQQQNSYDTDNTDYSKKLYQSFKKLKE